MRDDELRRTLTDSNPWWRAASRGTDPVAWVAGHRLLADRARHDLGYRAIVLADVALTAPLDDRLVILTGPCSLAAPAWPTRVEYATCCR